jgi:hypothetical protein
MKKISILILLITVYPTFCFNQKLDRKFSEINIFHIPNLLIYDQIKSYGYNISIPSNDPSGYSITEIENLCAKFTSFEKRDYLSANLRINVQLGIFQEVDTKIMSRTAEETVNNQKVKVNYYKVVYRFRYPINVEAINSKNGVKLYQNAYSNDNVRSLETSEYKTENEAKYDWNNYGRSNISNDLKSHIQAFIKGCNESLGDEFDFYPMVAYEIFYRLKKWEKEDEYNNNLKEIFDNLKIITSGENPKPYENTLSKQIQYLESFINKFNPLDKKEAVLYYANYFNLSSLYYCLDNLDKSKYYLSKLDSASIKENSDEILKKRIATTETTLNKHFLESRHINYNPVTDFRLTNKPFNSDALSTAENASKNFKSNNSSGLLDEVMFIDNKILKGKIVTIKETHTVKLIVSNNLDSSVTINPENAIYYTQSGEKYHSIKAFISGIATKEFMHEKYASSKIILLARMNGDFIDIKSYFTKKTKDQVASFWPIAGVKKALASYFEDCPQVSAKASNGDYGTMISIDEAKLRQACIEYSTLCK